MLGQNLAKRFELGFRIGRRMDQGRDAARHTAGGSAVQQRLHRAVKSDRVVQPQASVPAQLDQVAEAGVVHGLAHRGASEHKLLDAHEPSIAGQVHRKPAPDGAAVKQDAFLRQPLQRRARRHLQCGCHLGRRGAGQGAIEALRRL